MAKSILIVDDDPTDRELIVRSLRFDHEFASIYESHDQITCVETLAEHPEIECILLDYSLSISVGDGLHILKSLVEHYPSTAVVMVTGQGSEDIAVQAMRLGAQDYITKSNIDARNLKRAIENAIERANMLTKIREQQENLQKFARVLVHDLRSPLRSLKASVELLQDDLDESTRATHEKTLGFITKSSVRMDQLIVEISAYNSAQDEHSPPEWIDLDTLFNDLLNDLKADLKDRDASVTCQQALPRIKGYPVQIAQLFQNLISNGIKYNRSDKPQVAIDCTESDDTLLIAFVDNGIGIEPSVADQIFQPFKRLHCRREFDGTGLGLATCKKIVERHGGTIECLPAPSQGTMFRVALPKGALESHDSQPLQEAS